MTLNSARALGLLLALSTAGTLGCDRLKERASSPAVNAEFGVFFGGQIQERKEIPFELDATKQTHGFRVRFAVAPAEPHEIRWHLQRPRFSKPPTRKSKSEPSATPPPIPALEESGSALLPAGQREFSKVWSFQPADPLGVWNIRITLDQRVLIDRPFLVYDAQARAQINIKSRTDAGR